MKISRLQHGNSRHAVGRQYIVVAVGSKEAGSAQFVALSLP